MSYLMQTLTFFLFSVIITVLFRRIARRQKLPEREIKA